MRNVVYLLFIILPLSLLSCSSDDDSGTSSEIVGKWMNAEIHIEGEYVVAGMGTATMTGIATDNDPENYTVFHADNTLETHPKPMEMMIMVTIMGVEEAYEQEVNIDIPQFGQWQKEGDTLTISSEGETLDYTIEMLNASTLKISTDTIYTELPTEGGLELPDLDTFKMTIVFSRL